MSEYFCNSFVLAAGLPGQVISWATVNTIFGSPIRMHTEAQNTGMSMLNYAL